MAGEVSIPVGVVSTGAAVAPSISFAEGGFTAGPALVTVSAVEPSVSQQVVSSLTPITGFEAMPIEPAVVTDQVIDGNPLEGSVYSPAFEQEALQEVADGFQTANPDEEIALDAAQIAEELNLPDLAQSLRNEFTEPSDSSRLEDGDFLAGVDGSEAVLDGDESSSEGEEGDVDEDNLDGDEQTVEEQTEDKQPLEPDDQPEDQKEKEQPVKPPDDMEQIVLAPDVTASRVRLVDALWQSGASSTAIADAFRTSAQRSPVVVLFGKGRDGGVEAAVEEIEHARSREDAMLSAARHDAITLAKFGVQAPTSTVIEVLGNQPVGGSRRDPFGKSTL